MPEVVYRVAREFDVVTVRISQEVEDRVRRFREEGRCLGCEEKFVAGEKVTCGQCATCYQASMRKIDRKLVSRNQLIREGHMAKAGKGGRKPANKFTQKLAEM